MDTEQDCMSARKIELNPSIMIPTLNKNQLKLSEIYLEDIKRKDTFEKIPSVFTINNIPEITE